MLSTISLVIFRKTAIGTMVLLVLSLSLLSSCGGGGTSGDNYAGGEIASGDSYAGREIGGTGIYKGVITGFGSVWVNGIRFDTTGASVNGDVDSLDALKVGMKVEITGEVTNGSGRAESIVYESEMKGLVESISIADGAFVVLGYTILTDGSTIFEGITGISGLIPGQYVEVSGFFDADGDIRATLVEVKTTTGDYKVKGTVSNLSMATKTFRINDTLTVDYNGVANPPMSLKNGAFVEAESKVSPHVVNNILYAEELEIEDEAPSAVQGTKMKLEGIITSFTSQSSFVVNGQEVNAANAVFKHGTAGDLALNVKVEVEGTIDASGILIAKKVEFKSKDDDNEGDDDSDIDDNDDGKDDDDGKVTLCHIPPGNPENARTITVDEASVKAHLRHGDYLGPCVEDGDNGDDNDSNDDNNHDDDDDGKDDDDDKNEGDDDENS